MKTLKNQQNPALLQGFAFLSRATKDKEPKIILTFQIAFFTLKNLQIIA